MCGYQAGVKVIYSISLLVSDSILYIPSVVGAFILQVFNVFGHNIASALKQ
jgi:hypothetical protein